MEWIETTGKTVADAVEQALDMLGVDEDNLEYDVVTEPKGGFLGMGRTDARIRARVKPISREKPGERRRDRRRGGRKNEGAAKSGAKREAKAPAMAGATATPATPGAGEPTEASTPTDGTPAKRRRRRGGRGRSQSSSSETQPTGDSTVTTDLSIDDQADAAGAFVAGLLDTFDVDAQVDTVIEEDAILVDVQGSDLGLLLGPSGVTLAAIEELTRAAVLHRAGGSGARINVDVASYRAKRREALAAFATQLAEQVKESGTAKALEPMSPADRKVVHDTCAEIDGVATISEGEDHRRRVVITPA